GSSSTETFWLNRTAERSQPHKRFDRSRNDTAIRARTLLRSRAQPITIANHRLCRGKRDNRRELLILKPEMYGCAYTRPCSFVMLGLLLLSFSAQLHAATVTATWNPNPEPNIAGYQFSYGTTSGLYTTTIDVGKVTSTAVTLTDNTTYYFAVRAYNTAGLVGAYSAEAIVTTAASTTGSASTGSGSVVATPSITSVTPTTGAAGTVVTIAGANFGSTRGSSTVTFNGTPATPTSWSATSIVVPVPSGASTGNVVVTVGGVTSNGISFTMTTPGGSIGFVQSNYAVPQSPTASLAAPFTAAQTAGNLNVVVVGWNDSTQAVQSVTDSSGNIYTIAVGPTQFPGQLTQSIYYAKNIVAAVAGANSVTVPFTGAAVYPDVRIAEYRGLDLAKPLDVAIGATGTSATSDSGTLTTTSPNDLLVGANMVTDNTTAAGTSFTSRVITSPDGDIL